MATSLRHRTRIGALAAAFVLTATLSACSIEELVGDSNLCEGVGPVASVCVAPSSVSLRAGDSVQVYAAQLDARGGDTMICTAQDMSWSSAHPAIATVRGDRGGAWLIGVAPGQTTVQASAAGKSNSVNVTVTAR